MVLLGDCFGLWVHWFQRRTQPCLNDRCPASRHRAPIHWVGYYPAAVEDRGAINPETGKYVTRLKTVVVPCNQDQHRDISVYLEFPLLLTVSRRQEQRGFTLEKIKELPDAKGLPEVFPVPPVLYRAFGMKPPDKSQNYSREDKWERNGKPMEDSGPDTIRGE